MTYLRTYRWEITLAALALTVHTILFVTIIGVNGGSVIDTVRADDGYFELAQNVLAGNGFSWSSGAPYEPNPLRTPGYVYFLAALLGTVGIVGAAIVQLLLSALIPVLGMHIARHITDSRRIGIVAGVILALDPTLALLSFNFYTDTLFIVLFFGWTLLIFRYLEEPRLMTLAIGAAALGFAVITRPTAQYIPLLIVPFIVWRFGAREWRRSAVHVFVLLAIVGAILTPWAVRNYNEFGVLGLSAQRAYVLYTNLAPAVLSVANGTDFIDERNTFLTPAEYKGDAITLANGDTYAAHALEIVRAHPAATLFVATKSLFTFFTNDGFYTLLVRSGRSPADFLPLLIAMRLVWVGITLAALIGALVYLLTQRSQLTILVILLVAYFALTSTIAAFGTNPRYRLPVDPVIIALAALGVTHLLESIQRFRRFQY